jgi:hypothetical protein
MSGWSRTVKPSADTTIASGNIYGVDADEIKVTPGISHVGWAARRQVGSRVLWETLVAMKQPPTPDAEDDAVLPDTVITITAQPVDAELEANANATFSVSAPSSPTRVLAFQWQESPNSNVAVMTNLTNAGVYSNVTPSTLTISDSTDLDGYYYRVIVSNAAAGVTVTSNTAAIEFQ